MLDNDDIKRDMEINDVCNGINMERYCDCTDEDDDHSLVAPIWRILSFRLQELMDPAQNNQKYAPLKFDENYWKYNSNISQSSSSSSSLSSDFQFNLNKVSINDIFLELYTVTMTFKSIKQILIESNPTLNVITHFQDTLYITKKNEELISSIKTVSSKLYPAPSTIDPSETESIPTTSLILSPTASISTSFKSLCLSHHDINCIDVLPQFEIRERLESDIKELNKNENDIILSDDWWISSDYFDDDLEEETKALNEFHSFLNDDNNDGILIASPLNES